MPRLILFDLDGTLIDTAPELATAVNALLARLGRPPVPLAQVRTWIGRGARELLRQALRHHDVDGGESPSVDAAWAGFERDCAAACGTRSAPYPGVVSTLDALQAQGVRLALITNKESVLTQRVLAAHRLTSYFDLIVAGDTLPVRKPDPAVLRHALDTFGVEADDALFIGDSAIDVQAARNAGVPVWAVSYGYDSAALRDDHAPDRLVDSLDALLTHPTHITLS
ncbi:phosphoglycolate phosphatase [Rhizobacter fulvus]|jgi:phosphoglycolate phosphatase